MSEGARTADSLKQALRSPGKSVFVKFERANRQSRARRNIIYELYSIHSFTECRGNNSDKQGIRRDTSTHFLSLATKRIGYIRRFNYVICP